MLARESKHRFRENPVWAKGRHLRMSVTQISNSCLVDSLTGLQSLCKVLLKVLLEYKLGPIWDTLSRSAHDSVKLKDTEFTDRKSVV